jgi:hypothetical protein
LEPPDSDFLAAHLAIANILAVSGIGAKIDHYLSQYELNDGSIERDGSTDLGSMISWRLMQV